MPIRMRRPGKVTWASTGRPGSVYLVDTHWGAGIVQSRHLNPSAFIVIFVQVAIGQRSVGAIGAMFGLLTILTIFNHLLDVPYCGDWVAGRIQEFFPLYPHGFWLTLEL